MVSFKEYSKLRKIKTHYDILRNNPVPEKIHAAHELGLITKKQRKELLGRSREIK